MADEEHAREDEVLFASGVEESIFGKIGWQSKRKGEEIPGSRPKKYPVFIKKTEIQTKAQAYRDRGEAVPSWLEGWLTRAGLT